MARTSARSAPLESSPCEKPATARDFEHLSGARARESPLVFGHRNKPDHRQDMASLRALSNALLTNDRHQRVRLAQAWLACTLLFCCVLVLHAAAAFGLTDDGPLWWWSAASLAGMLVVVGVIRSGLNKQFA